MELDDSLAIAKALGDRSRLLILNALRSGPLCVEDIAARLDLASSTVSFHLKKLAAAGLATIERDQYYSVYSLASRAPDVTLGELISFRNTEETRQARRAADEIRRVLDTFFRGDRLTRMPAQKKKRDIVLGRFASLFAPGKTYPERQVDEAILPLFEDYCLVRRLLVDEGYFTREKGRYMRTEKEVAGEVEGKERQKHLRREYKNADKVAGVFRIRNRATGRVFLGSALNLHGPLNRIEFELRLGSFRNRQLQEDFDRCGREAFDFAVLEVVEPQDEPGFHVERGLETLERIYAEGLDRSNTYNTEEDIRFLSRRTAS